MGGMRILLARKPARRDSMGAIRHARVRLPRPCAAVYAVPPMSRDEGAARTPSARGIAAVTLACFFLSGFAALLYQTVWTRQFAFVFGTADLAVATVLAAYMGGLAL